MKTLSWIFLASLLLLTLSVGGALAQGGGDNPNATVVPDLLFVRETPSTAADVIGELPRTVEVTVVGVERNPNDSGTWVFIETDYDNISGWVRSDFLRFPADFVGLSTLPNMDDARGMAGNTETEATSTVVDDETVATTSTGDTVTVTIEEGVALEGETNQYANLRTGPELTFDLIEQLDPNTELLVVGRNRNNVWLQVLVEDQVGWVFFSLVEVDGDLNSLPVVGPGEAPPVTIVQSDGNSEVGSSSGAPEFIRIDPSVSDADGRINGSDSLGPYILYCVNGEGYTNVGNYEGGGIGVYRWEDSRFVFWASEAQINARLADPEANQGIVDAENNFVMYAYGDRQFILNGPDGEGRTFRIDWQGCQGGRVN